MSRWVDLRADPVAERLELEPGDIAVLPAAGARVSSGSAVTVAGVYRSAIRLSDGRVLAPAGPPDVVVLAAARRGAATVQLTTGDPFHGLPPRELVVVVA